MEKLYNEHVNTLHSFYENPVYNTAQETWRRKTDFIILKCN